MTTISKRKFECFHRVYGHTLHNGALYAHSAREALANFKVLTPTAKVHWVAHSATCPSHFA